MRFCLFSKFLHYKPKIDPGGDEQGDRFFCETFGIGGFSPHYYDFVFAQCQLLPVITGGLKNGV